MTKVTLIKLGINIENMQSKSNKEWPIMRTRRWFQSYPEGVEQSVEINIPDLSLVDLLINAIHERPDQIALVFENEQYTYKELGDISAKLASQFKKRGVNKGTRVALMMNNCPDLIFSYYGILMAGGIVVQNNPMYKERELAYQIKDSESEIIIIEEKLLNNIPSIEQFIDKVIVSRTDHHAKYETLNELISAGNQHFEPVTINPKEDIAVLQYTGGTTGVSKGVMLSHYNLVSNVIQTDKFLGVNSARGEERILNVLPLFHVYGMTVSMNYNFYLQSTLYLVERFDAEEILSIIQDEKITMFPGTPTIYVSVINIEKITDYDLSSIHLCISGSSPLSVETKRTFEKLTGAKLVDAYGLSEASPVTHSNPVIGVQKPGSMGVPIPGTDCKIVDAEDGITELEINEPGELIVKGPQVMNGYWNRPDETADALRDGWLYTGDIAYMDKDGYCFIVSRKKDVIIASGYNIYPREIEEVLYEHPAVSEAVVYGVPHSYRGETVQASIVLKKEYTNQIDEDTIIDYCKGKLAAYKIPTLVEFREELPKSTVGKVLRRKLIEENVK